MFENVVEEWLKRDQADNKPSTLYAVSRMVERYLLPAWRGKAVDEITKRDVIALLDAIMDRGAPVKARQTFSHANRFFRWCIERDILTANPMAGLKRSGNGKSRDRVLTDAELVEGMAGGRQDWPAWSGSAAPSSDRALAAKKSLNCVGPRFAATTFSLRAIALITGKCISSP